MDGSPLAVCHILLQRRGTKIRVRKRDQPTTLTSTTQKREETEGDYEDIEVLGLAEGVGEVVEEILGEGCTRIAKESEEK